MTPEMKWAIRDFCEKALNGLGKSEVVAKSSASYCLQVLDELAAAEADVLTLALRLLDENPDSFSPEAIEVMFRIKSKCEAILADPEGKI